MITLRSNIELFSIQCQKLSGPLQILITQQILIESLLRARCCDMLWGCQVDPTRVPTLKASWPNEGDTLIPAPTNKALSPMLEQCYGSLKVALGLGGLTWELTL